LFRLSNSTTGEVQSKAHLDSVKGKENASMNSSITEITYEVSERLLGPLGVLLDSLPKQIPSILMSLRLCTVGSDGHMYALEQYKDIILQRGKPGHLLLPQDIDRLDYRPTREYITNEIVAIQGDDGQYRYGCIVADTVSGENENTSRGNFNYNNKNGVSTHDSNENVMFPTVQTFLKQVSVRVSSTEVRDIFCTKIYSFASTKAISHTQQNSLSDKTIHHSSSTSTSKDKAPNSVFVEWEGDLQLNEAPIQKSNSLNLSPSSTSDQARDEYPSFSDQQKARSSSRSPKQQEQLLFAVEEILGKCDLSLGHDRKRMMENHLTLQRNLDQEKKCRIVTSKKLEVLTERMEKIKSFYQCQICFDLDTDLVLVPCGHGLCGNCYGQNRNNCPFCRKRVSSTTPLYKPGELNDG